MLNSNFELRNFADEKYSIWWRWFQAYSVLMKPSKGMRFNDLNCYTWEKGKWQLNPDPNAYDWAKNVIRFFAECESRPWILLNGPTDALRHIQIEEEILEEIRDESIAIFLYEPIVFLDEKTLRPWVPRDRESIDFVSVELESILQFNEHHGGNLNITVYVCDEGLSEVMARHPRYSKINVQTLDLFFVEGLMRYENGPGLISPNLECAKTAICLNFRYEPIRELIVGYLRAQNYHPSSYITFYHNHDFECFKNLAFDFDNWGLKSLVLSGIQAMQPELPYSLEAMRTKTVDVASAPIPNLGGESNRLIEKEISRFYKNAHVVIVNETRFFTHFPNISEKTLNAAFFGKPFIVGGATGSLKYMRKLGFETFSEFWDESYDEECDFQTRIEKLLRTVDFVYSLSRKELSDLTWEMYPKLLLNQLNLTALLGEYRRFLQRQA